MLDFLMVSTKTDKNGVVEIYPKFVIKKSSDLMVRGGDFYAIWVEERGLWSTDEQDALQLIDHELSKYADEYRNKFGPNVRVLYLWDAENGIIDRWHKFCQKQMRDNYHPLDEKLIFSNMEITKKDYASKRLSYPLEPGDITAYDKLISTLYSEDERHKIEWAIGAIVTGDSKNIQKFMVLYGSAGTGKSTIINIIQQLFDGYYSVFVSKELGSGSSDFALESFKTNPLLAIEHDGDLSRIEDNTRINSIVSHEIMLVNEKFKAKYPMRFNCFLIIGTNKPVKITDAKSGLIRRLIDVTPSGNKLPVKEYNKLVKQVGFELGAIAYHCRDVYLADPGAYDTYLPVNMLGASNDFYNFIIDSYHVFKKEDGTTLTAAWEMYKTYCEDARVAYPYSKRAFGEELRNYFWRFEKRASVKDGRFRSYYDGFRTDKFEVGSQKGDDADEHGDSDNFIGFGDYESVFDKVCASCPAQYANDAGTPFQKWEKVTTILADIDTRKLHYVKVPENHIVIDFDIKNADGNKSLKKNIEAASKWPATYAELSKSGAGIHLHYIYTGDASRLSRVFDSDIEVKVFTGNSSLRRMLTKCNDLPIATISSGLPMKGDDKVVDFKGIENERMLRSMIKKNLSKEVHASTKCSIDFIYKILNDAYTSGLSYDVSDMHNSIFAFGAQSSHQSDYCIKLIGKMKFKSEDTSASAVDASGSPLVFYDVEVFPNLFLVCWKAEGEGKPVVRMINPKPSDIEELMRFKLVGYNNRRYDNHMLYACLMGYNNEQLYNLSQKIINSEKGSKNKAFFGEAYNISYTDVYDFASAGNKMSLKKMEIEMGIHHQELGLPWDEPVPEELWEKVGDYCCNDVIATEAAFNYLSADWTARQILADLAGMSVNDTTNTLTTRIIFGNNRKPQNEFNYRNLAEPVYELDPETEQFLKEACPEMMAERHGEANSLLPYFPGYKYENGKSTYRGIEIGEGGLVIAKPGMNGNDALLDVMSMHPHSVIAECLFGPKYTLIFKKIVDGRVEIKHEEWDEIADLFDGKLVPYIQKVKDGEMTSKDLANALKTAINSVYGLTSAHFDNAFRDIRNKDNIVAKRGALFMVDLMYAVQERGFTVAHIKTDSIKIPDATPEIIKFVMDFGKRYGYTFEHEATYDRMCLVNNAVYIAKYKDVESCERLYDYIPGDNKKHGGEWTATGKQFAVPYVFKTLFSNEPIDITDMCETFSVKSALYLDMNEKLPDVSKYEKELEKLENDYKKGKLSDITFESSCAELNDKIAQGHSYRFIGKVGQFCPIKPGCGGGLLMREQDGKYCAASGTTGYRWLESEIVLTPGNESSIDRAYYDKLVNDAVEAISKYGDFEWFASDDPYISPDFINVPEGVDEEIPFN